MADNTQASGPQLRPTVKPAGILELSLEQVQTPAPKPEEVVVRVDATPINPSDLGLLLAAADLTTLKKSGSAERPVTTASIAPEVLRAMGARLGQSLPVGNE